MTARLLKYAKAIVLLIICSVSHTKAQTIHTTDIANFWIAYDKIQQSNSLDRQLDIINSIYLNPGTEGLQKFCKIMNYTDSAYVKAIVDCPKFWNSLRLKTTSLEETSALIQNHLVKLKGLYPNLQVADLFLCLGLGNSGGKPIGKDLVIGLELALGDSSINTSEYTSQSKKDFYNSAQSGGLEHIAIHEYIHTQQKNVKNNYVLKQAIREGSCDFIAELVVNKKLNLGYIKYGYAHYDETLNQLKADLVNPNYNNWFYNSKVETIKDLGYFAGYAIAKKYYENSADKKKAIAEIIDLDYSNNSTIFTFLNKSKIYNEQMSYDKELEKFKNNCPTIESTTALKNNNIMDSKTDRIGITFSKAMKNSTSISFSDKGKSSFPLKKIIGFSEDKKTLWLELAIEKGKDYEFVITNKAFQSEEGFPLREDTYLIHFKTED